MTPQTAAALRALEQIAVEMRNAQQRDASGDIVAACMHAWECRLTAAHAELAAVLTQEGAECVFRCTPEMERFIANPRASSDEPLFTASMYGTAADADKARDEWRAAQSEPRAAEGAGTWTREEIAASEKAGEELLREWSDDEPDRSVPPCLECGALTLQEAATKCICSGDKDDCHGCELWPDTPTAAAAVPAGGDAVAWAIRMPDGEISHLGWMDMRHYESAKQLMVLSKGCEFTFAYAAPAPRGGVTEAVAHLIATIRGAMDHYRAYGNDILDAIRAVEAEAATPPAAQAQDAGPK